MLGFLIPLFFNQFDKLPDVVLSCVATNFCVSPLAWWFIILRGAYDLKKDKLQNNTDSCLPNLHPASSPKVGRRQIGNASTISRRSGIPYGGIGTCAFRALIGIYVGLRLEVPQA